MTLLSEKIKILRKKKGFSLDKLAELSNTSKSYIWELENNNSTNPTTDKLTKIADALSVTLQYLSDNNAELTNDVVNNAFYKKFRLLDMSDQKRIMQMIDIWSKKEK